MYIKYFILWVFANVLKVGNNLGRCFLKDYFYCYCQQIITLHEEHQKNRTLNTINKYGTPNQIKQMYNTAQFPSTATFASLKHKQ